jgi:ABC-type nitrate/sulfonate/bicarbonate transport system substrate-binding protein
MPDTSGILAAQRYCTWVNKSWARANAASVAAFVKAQLAACDWLIDPANKEKAISILIDHTKTTPGAAALTYDMYAKSVFAGKVLVDLKALSTFLNAAQAGGAGPFKSPDQYFDLSYIGKA